jgi:hypothetical protein
MNKVNSHRPGKSPGYDTYLSIWLNHVEAIAADIGPRGSTTEQERQASDFCEKIFQDLDLNPRMEFFQSAKSIYLPHLMASLLMLSAFILYPLYGRLTAALAASLSLFTIISQLLELSFRDNLFRKLVPKGKSQNVFAFSPAKKTRKQDLILIGHVDSHRSPLVFRSYTWVKVYQAFTTVGFLLSMAQVVLYTIGIFVSWPWIWPLTIPSAISSILLAAMCLEADSTEFSPGANDNASAVGLILTLAYHLQNEPLDYSDVWFVCTGCEEVQHYGAIDFFRRHKAEFKDPKVVVFEMLGCAGPTWLTKEGIVVPFLADQQLIQIAEQVSESIPSLGGYPSLIKGGNTEMADALRVGIPAITLGGMDRDGTIPYWHQIGDTFDKMDPEVMSRNYQFAWEFINAVDAIP